MLPITKAAGQLGSSGTRSSQSDFTLEMGLLLIGILRGAVSKVSWRFHVRDLAAHLIQQSNTLYNKLTFLNPQITSSQ